MRKSKAYGYMADIEKLAGIGWRGAVSFFSHLNERM